MPIKKNDLNLTDKVHIPEWGTPQLETDPAEVAAKVSAMQAMTLRKRAEDFFLHNSDRGLVDWMADFARSVRQAARKECAEIAEREAVLEEEYDANFECGWKRACASVAAAIERLED